MCRPPQKRSGACGARVWTSLRRTLPDLLSMRIDRWLWAIRIYKTRSISAEAVKAGHVRVNGSTVKPAHEVRPGQIITAWCEPMTRTVKVIGEPASRVGAKLVPEYLEDLTPPEEFEKRREPNLLPPALRERGAGRPTKRDRREIDRLES